MQWANLTWISPMTFSIGTGNNALRIEGRLSTFTYHGGMTYRLALMQPLGRFDQALVPANASRRRQL